MLKRPTPPSDMQPFQPAPEIFEWVMANIVDPDGAIHNPDHIHLKDLEMPTLSFMWADGAFEKQGRLILGQCEKVAFRAGGWQKLRQEMQMQDWFGDVPNFLITLDARFCAQCTDAEFCALVEHELYHIAHSVDLFGFPKYNRQTGEPVLAMRGHDVEEFIGVVRRYGASEDVQRLVDAANNRPEVSLVDIAHSCGTCLLRLA